MEIKPQHLRHLAAIGTHGSFVKAAGSLKISQPALSLSIQRIEDITKVKLVDRGRNGAKLTRAGRALARHGGEIDAAVQSAADDIDLLSHGISGRLRIGGTPLSTNGLIPEVISRILNTTIDVAISVTEGVDEDLLDMLARNELDVVIGAPGTTANESVFCTRPLFSARTVLVARPGHPLHGRDVVSLSDLQDVIWAIPPEGGSFRAQIEAVFTANGIPFPQRTVQAASIHVLKRIVRLSDAVTLAAEQIVRDEVERGQLIWLGIAEPVAFRVFGLHTRARTELGDLGELFCELAAELAPEFTASKARSKASGEPRSAEGSGQVLDPGF